MRDDFFAAFLAPTGLISDGANTDFLPADLRPNVPAPDVPVASRFASGLERIRFLTLPTSDDPLGFDLPATESPWSGMLCCRPAEVNATR